MKKKTILRRLLSLAAAGALCLGMALPAGAAETASAIQVTKTQGTVAVVNSRGRDLSLRDNMRLYNGYQVTTEKSSYAWLNLDDAKLAKQDAASVVEVRKSGKKLELLVSSGSLYFNVTEPLASDETLNIRTSNMVTGVRGTCGWVESVDSGHSQVYVLEGRLECLVTDPVSGQSKTAAIRSGEVGNFYVYTRAQGGEYCAVTTERFSEDDINGFVLKELAGDSALCGKIQAASGLNVRGAVGRAQAVLAADEAAMNRRVDDSRQQAASQAGSISRTPVWNGEGGGSSVEQPASASAEQLSSQLAQAGVDNVTVSGSAGVPETITVDKALDVPAGKTLTLGDNVNIVVQSGARMNVAGTLHAAGDLTNNGTIDVTSGNTLRVDGQLINAAGSTIDNHSSGRIIASGGILNAGTILNRDSAQIISQGIATVRQQSGGVLRVTGGAIINDGSGYALLQEGAMTSAQAKAILSSAGTGAFRSRTGNVLGAVNAAGVYTSAAPEGYSAQLQSSGYYCIGQGGGSSQPQSGGGDGGGTTYLPSTYTLSFDPNGGALASGAGAPVREGYTFNGWADSTGKPFGAGAIVSSNMTLYAQWIQNSGQQPEHPAYTVTYDPNGGTLSAQGAAPVRAGHTFLGWSPAQDGSAAYPTTVSSDLTLYAQWRQDSGDPPQPSSYAFQFELDGGTMTGGVPTKTGYTFAGWYTDSTLTQGLESLTEIARDTTLYAKWETASTGGGNEVEVGPFLVTGGEPDKDYKYFPDTNHGQLEIKTSAPLTIRNKNPGNEENARIYTSYYGPSEVNIILAGVNLKNTSASAIEVYGKLNLTLQAGTANALTGAYNSAGLEVHGGLVISGSGELTANGGYGGAGIGGGNGSDGSNITINGGTVTAIGGDGAAGIGGGRRANDRGGNGRNITITDGKVTAVGGVLNSAGNPGGAGIGGGKGGNGTNITISGGTVEVTGGGYAAGIGGGNSGSGQNIVISNGTVTVTGGFCGAAIGGGDEGSGINIAISGGTVTTTGGQSAAGIGGGFRGNGETITISGGTVAATGGYSGAGIGGGSKYSGSGGNGVNITISGGTAEATGGTHAAGIGGGESGAGSYITINGGTVEATGGQNGAGIGGGSALFGGVGDGSYITINGGTVEATGGQNGAGIGGGSCGDGEMIIITGGEITAAAGSGANAVGGGYRGTSTGIHHLGGTVNGKGSGSSGISAAAILPDALSADQKRTYAVRKARAKA